jgi:hypothetical protein
MSKTKKLLSIIVLFVTILSTSVVSPAQAVSFTLASDRISDSDVNATNVTHNISLTTHVSLAQNEYIDITFPAALGSIIAHANVTCSGTLNGTRQSAQVARCTNPLVGAFAPGVVNVTVTGMTNTGTPGTQLIGISSHNAGGGTTYESATVAVAIINSVTVQANVPSSLTFSVNGLATSTPVNSATTTGSSTATQINFGTLVASTTYSSVMGQQLSVITNASFGFKVTVEQDQNLVSLSGATIDSFANNTPPVSPAAWSAPTGTLDATSTYGHMGFTTNDATLSSTTPNLYVGDKWMGFTGTGTQEIMFHTGPADGSMQDKGSVKVAYRIQITALQEAGDYTNSLTYVATPTY